jgi:hypothetical protein
VLNQAGSRAQFLVRKKDDTDRYQNYTHPILDEAETQWFKAKIQSQEYASGGVENASKGSLVILISTFLLNSVVLVYFVVQPGLVTDFSQPPRLFALAVNSEPTRALVGSCGGGPEGKEYKVGWLIHHDEGHVYIEPRSGEISALLTDETDPDRIAAPRIASPLTSNGSSLLFAILTPFCYLKRNFVSRTWTPAKETLASSTESLRPTRTTGSVPVQSQYELGEMSTRTEQQYTRLSLSKSTF